MQEAKVEEFAKLSDIGAREARCHLKRCKKMGPSQALDTSLWREVRLELRKWLRYRLTLGVTFSWRSATGESQMGTGHTRDISTAGVFVLSDECPPQDARLSCDITVPRSRSAGYLQIKGEGTVIRLDRAETDRQSGFAVFGPMLVKDETVSDFFTSGE